MLQFFSNDFCFFPFICGSSIQCQTLVQYIWRMWKEIRRNKYLRIDGTINISAVSFIRMSESFRARRGSPTLATQKRTILYDGFWRCDETSIWFELRYTIQVSAQHALRRAVINHFGCCCGGGRHRQNSIFAIDFLPINSAFLHAILAHHCFFE